MTWTADAELLLKQWWNEGYSATEISHKLGSRGVWKTRNAIIGKVHRMGMARRAPSAPKHARKSRAGATRPRSKINSKTNTRVMERPKPLRVVPVKPADAEREGISFEELTANTCRWPVGTGTGAKQKFCGCQIDPFATQPYCTEHMARSASKATPEQREEISQRMKRYHAKKRAERAAA
ncbi:MAG: GcrA family cell cycle regulator [Pseudomonadota bacterium]